MDWDLYDKRTEFANLVGKTLTSIEAEVGGDVIVFTCDDGSVFQQYHGQDCCESVSIESITGDLSDLIGSPILRAEESTSETDPEDYKPGDREEWRDSFTWTFYKLATVKGWVDIRWYGESNGYYSESVDFAQIK